jgi:MFS transporter, AAHS family, benzoate transport protein
MATAGAGRLGTFRSRLSWPLVLCWLTVLLEGYDLVALGATSLALRHASHLQFTPARLSLVATLSLVGVAIGATFVTPFTDLVGRRMVLVASVLWFSVFTLLVPLSPNFETFAVLRLIAGLGLGSCMPTALAAMSDYLPPQRRARATTTTMTGYHCGAVLASLLALAVHTDWQMLFYVGGAIGVGVGILQWVKMPETAQVRTTLTHRHADAAQKVTIADMLQPRFLRITLAVWVATFMGLVLVYGLNTWLPTLMKTAGYSVSTSIILLFILNAGGVAGMLLAGHVGDTRGIRATALAWFGIGAVLLAVLSIKFHAEALLDVVIFLTGVFVFSAQVLVFAYVTQAYAPEIRGSALGITSGVGRIGSIVGPAITGALVSAGKAYPWGFYLFTLAGILGLLSMLVSPRVHKALAAPARSAAGASPGRAAGAAGA